MTIFENSVKAVLISAMLPLVATASSHREAPFIAGLPRVDATDFYLFNSYETGRDAFVTILANYVPLQDAYGGPNYFELDDEALYEIHIDNNADAVEDITFQFRFDSEVRGAALDIDGEEVPIPLKQAGPVGPAATDTDNLNVSETYTVDLVRGDRRSGMQEPVSLAADGSTTFVKPVDNIGNKTLADYAAYANEHIYDVSIPGCGDGRLFVGQRREGFVVNLGETFDLINTDPLGPPDGEANTLEDKNVTTLALEVPVTCLAGPDSGIVGGWTTASVRQARVINPSPDTLGPAINGGAYTQVSRLGAPLVNEVVIGLRDKNKFNASYPWDDVANFAIYVTNPTLPVILQVLFGVTPPNVPRNDLVAVFVTGVPGL
ncbi:MAG: DUF4331 domain-containing protein, partial [Woeseiaceae bacterium]